MEITSPSFLNGQMIPKKFTCQGEDINPALFIKELPKATKSLALVVDDPDAPGGVWYHWIVYNIPVVEKISENSIPGIEIKNSFKKKGYGGPCPPSGTHRYFFKVYALEKKLDLKEDASYEDLREAMKGYILSEAQIIGLYEKE